MAAALSEILRRDLRLALRQSGDTVTVLAVFMITAMLFPLGVGPEPNVLARMAPGILWVTALLASTLALDRLFRGDYEDGSLDLLLLAPPPLALVAMMKCAAHWLTTGLPLAVIAPLLAVALNMPTEGIGVMVVALLLGTPALTLVGGVGAGLTLGARRGDVLLSLLVLPLYVPVLIFGVAAVDAAIMGAPAEAHLMILAALLLLAVALAPWAMAAALRHAAE